MTASSTANYQAMARQYAAQYGVDPDVFVAQINQESGFRPDAVSPAGALGIAQFMPATAASAGVDPMDPRSALNGAARYMGQLLSKYGGSYPMALAAYNAGEGAVDKYHGVPPYSETQTYVQTIMSAAGHAPRTPVAPNDPYASGAAPTVPPAVPDSAAPGMVSPYSNVVIPKTAYAVVPGSAAYGDVLYGRRYRVVVTDGAGTAPTNVLPDTAAGQAAAQTEYTALDVSALRCTFNCVSTAFLQPVWSTVTIYNLSPETEATIIKEGYRVIIEAGYWGSQYGAIFDGDVLQVIRNKEDGTTYTLTLVAMDGDTFLAYGTSVFSVLRGENSRTVVGKIASTASVPTQLGRISPSLSTTTLPRGQAFFGKSADLIRRLAASENAAAHVEGGKLHLTKASDMPVGEVIDLSPQTGLIGVPAQQDYGASIKMLLNPRVKTYSLVHVDNSLIRNQQYDINQVPYSLDADGLYRVVRVTHVGDTRGGDWFTECETVSQTGAVPNLIANGQTGLW